MLRNSNVVPPAVFQMGTVRQAWDHVIQCDREWPQPRWSSLAQARVCHQGGRLRQGWRLWGINFLKRKKGEKKKRRKKRKTEAAGSSARVGESYGLLAQPVSQGSDDGKVLNDPLGVNRLTGPRLSPWTTQT